MGVQDMLSNGIEKVQNNNIVGFVTDIAVMVIILIVIATVGQRLWNHGVQPLLPNVVARCEDPKQLISLALMISLLIPGGRLQGSKINITRQITDGITNTTNVDIDDIDATTVKDAGTRVVEVVDNAGRRALRVVDSAGQIVGRAINKVDSTVDRISSNMPRM